jgi:hypothetical protein
VGFSETPALAAFERTAISVLPSFKPITLVGVFSLAKAPSCLTSSFVHSLPVFLVYFGMINSPCSEIFQRLGQWDPHAQRTLNLLDSPLTLVLFRDRPVLLPQNINAYKHLAPLEPEHNSGTPDGQV